MGTPDVRLVVGAKIDWPDGGRGQTRADAGTAPSPLPPSLVDGNAGADPCVPSGSPVPFLARMRERAEYSAGAHRPTIGYSFP